MPTIITRQSALVMGLAAGVSAMLPWSVRAQSRAQAAGKFTLAAPMPRAMGEVVGLGIDGSFYVFAGLIDETNAPIGAAYRYDEGTGKWFSLARMPEPAHHVMATAHEGLAYVFGGFFLPKSPALAWQPTSGSWCYDPATNQWRKLTPLPRARGAGQAVTIGNKIYVIGVLAQVKTGEHPSRFRSAIRITTSSASSMNMIS